MTSATRTLVDLGAVAPAAVVASAPDSELEVRTARVFRRARLAGWVSHAVVEGFEVDFVFAEQRLVVEVDGWPAHGARRDQWEDDRERDLVLAARGWLVVQLTWRMVTRAPGRAADRLAAALSQRSPGSTSATGGRT
jgi:very-short-patch-repair endonuclease